MAKEKESSTKSTPKKAATKKSPAKKAASKTPAVPKMAEKIPAPKSETPGAAVAAPSTKPALPSAAKLHEEIRVRAYQLFHERGGQHGLHEADWHKAENEVRARYKA